MTLQTAATILERLGPCHMLLNIDLLPDLASELGLMGCGVCNISSPTPEAGGGGGYLEWGAHSAGPAFAAALRPFEQAHSLVLKSAGRPRAALEQALFAAGWRRHPGGMTSLDYEHWSAESLPRLTVWQRATGDSGGLLRQGGTEADAAIARFAMAAGHVRPGDRVLVDGEHSVDGAEILTALSRAGRVDAVGEQPMSDHSIDLIIAFEPFSSSDWAARIADYGRLLKFDGRLVVGWRNRPGDNRRPADFDSFAEVVSSLFIAEKRWVQRPLGGDPAGPHGLYPVALEDRTPSDWHLMVACANPLAGEGDTAGFEHPAYPAAGGPWPALVDFGHAYDNPWLYRSMVQMGERVADDMTLARLAECVIEDAPAESADRGAALAVLGYRVLEMRMPDLATNLLPHLMAYAGEPSDSATPAHVQRWRISLAFLAARLHELTGDRAAAKHWYRQAAQAQWTGFSPLLATKSIAAAFYEARLWLADGDTGEALACFRQGLDTALAAAAFPHEQQMGPQDRPLSFYLQELAEVIDMGSQCANALAHIHLWERDPGLFWRQVDIRRFGLASWARDLERENRRLRGG